MVSLIFVTMSWLLAPHNTIFATAFVVLICFALLEGISLIMGLGISDYLSDLLGLSDGSDTAVESSSEYGGGNPFLSWLEVGKVPVLVSVCAFLAAFSITGMLLQQTLVLLGPGPLLPWIAAAVAFFVALPVLKFSNRLLSRILPKDETSSFDANLLLGRVGVVTIGTATADLAAEVKVTGPDGRSHYVMVFVSGDSVSQGGEVLIEHRAEKNGYYHGTRNTNPDLSPKLYL
jgi:hypothetical protein